MKQLSTIGLAIALCAVSFGSLAETAAKPAKKAAKPAAVAKAPAEPPAASPEQINAAERVYYGAYACEFDKTLDVSISPKYPGYVELHFGKSAYVMKPIVSSTGAIRLEDVKGETLVVQIAAKSMLLNVKTGQRVLDGCISEKQGKVAATS